MSQFDENTKNTQSRELWSYVIIGGISRRFPEYNPFPPDFSLLYNVNRPTIAQQRSLFKSLFFLKTGPVMNFHVFEKN